ncbi:unnamed protein product [Toxocara canis]|nr:unnamed protein product [Toxocara canis]
MDDDGKHCDESISARAIQKKFLSKWASLKIRLEQGSMHEENNLLHELSDSYNETMQVCVEKDRKMYRQLYKILLKEAQKCPECVRVVHDSGIGNSLDENSTRDSPCTTRNGIRRRPNRNLMNDRRFLAVKGKSAELTSVASFRHTRNTSTDKNNDKSNWFEMVAKLVVYIVLVVFIISFFSTSILPLPSFSFSLSYSNPPPI